MRTVLLLMLVMGCGGDDAIEPSAENCVMHGGEGCFELPTAPIGSSMMGGAEQPASLDCDWPAPANSTGAITINGRTVDLLTMAAVGEVLVESFSDLRSEERRVGKE